MLEGLLCALSLGIALASCDAPPTGRVNLPGSSTAPPPSVARESWLLDNGDGTYSITPDVDCVELEQRSPPIVSRSLRPAKVSARVERGKLVIDELAIDAPLPRIGDSPVTVSVGAPRSLPRERSMMPSAALSRSGVTPWIGDDALLLDASDGNSDAERWALRLYAVLDEAAAVEEHISARMPEAAMRAACQRDRRWHEQSERASFGSGSQPPWTRLHALLRTYQGCGYDEDIPIEVFVRRARHATLVLAVMGLSAEAPSETRAEVARFVSALGASSGQP